LVDAREAVFRSSCFLLFFGIAVFRSLSFLQHGCSLRKAVRISAVSRSILFSGASCFPEHAVFRRTMLSVYRSMMFSNT
jgi:hypothetical protein